SVPPSATVPSMPWTRSRGRSRRGPVMAPRPDRLRRRFLAWSVVAVLVVLAAMPAYLVLPPSWRLVATQIACAVFAALGSLHALRWARGRVGPPSVSPLDGEPPPLEAPELHWRFVRFRDDVIWSTRSQRYFDAILWPRLVELSANGISRP